MLLCTGVSALNVCTLNRGGAMQEEEQAKGGGEAGGDAEQVPPNPELNVCHANI